ncbi:UNVERIFIED_CONTAM: hypothetical protein NCL1_15401 [Trichonephila clavipes]
MPRKVGMFNEGSKSLLYFMSAMELSLGTVAHVYVGKEDAWKHARRKNGLTTTPAGLIRSYRYCRRSLLWPWNR